MHSYNTVRELLHSQGRLPIQTERHLIQWLRLFNSSPLSLLCVYPLV